MISNVNITHPTSFKMIDNSDVSDLLSNKCHQLPIPSYLSDSTTFG
jgi:hypothetical protein